MVRSQSHLLWWMLELLSVWDQPSQDLALRSVEIEGRKAHA